ncbi:DUF1080 domain-containing protein [uncultured Algibacter sp.]|uniref:3-keto-disaccharide hydrolase n=1 Tax=uncultured Algibacter sp. TaxID=298659 RepID=UPI002624CA8C|nr:DUF1080 domain-containing protein [uncultured Algibacter sp.]
MNTFYKPYTNNLFKTILLSFTIIFLVQCKHKSQSQEKTNTINVLAGDALSNFHESNGWQMVEAVKAVPNKTEFTITSNSKNKGTILNNGATKIKHPFLITKQAFQDVKIDLEFMVPKGSNAGVYVMDRYEIQILDSYGVAHPTFADLGGIYQRWDPKKEDDLRGYGGVAPRVNASKAPGEWQTLSIIFRAPRFDSEGNKTENARFISVKVNNQLVQDNVEVEGPTRRSEIKPEVPTAPIAIQGNHGPVAIKKFEITPLDKDPLLAIEEEWTTLFNGKDLSGWAAYTGGRGDENALKGDRIFKVNNDVIHIYEGAKSNSKQHNANLVSEQVYSNFHLQVEYRWLKKKFEPRTKANRDAGILFHIHTDLQKVWPHSIEMQLGDGKSGGKYVTGDIFVIKDSRAETPIENNAYKKGAPLSPRGMLDTGRVGRGKTSIFPEKEIGEWNLAEIIVNGNKKATYYMNGVLVNEVYNMQYKATDSTWKPLISGPISLQAEWAELQYRTIRLKKLNPTNQ